MFGNAPISGLPFSASLVSRTIALSGVSAIGQVKAPAVAISAALVVAVSGVAATARAGTAGKTVLKAPGGVLAAGAAKAPARVAAPALGGVSATARATAPIVAGVARIIHVSGVIAIGAASPPAFPSGRIRTLEGSAGPVHVPRPLVADPAYWLRPPPVILFPTRLAGRAIIQAVRAKGAGQGGSDPPAPLILPNIAAPPAPAATAVSGAASFSAFTAGGKAVYKIVGDEELITLVLAA